MNLTAAEVVAVRALGLFLIEKCNGCGRALNQTFRYTIAGRPEVFCSALCRDTAFFADRGEARKHSTPGKCAYSRTARVASKGSGAGPSTVTRLARSERQERDGLNPRRDLI
jgi:hypothetical protein